MYTVSSQVTLVPILEIDKMRMVNGYIYFAEFVWSGLIKIGWTSNVRNRMRGLENDFKQPIELLDYIEGDVQDELELHRSLDRFTIEPYTSDRKGRPCEVYFPERELIDYIDGLQGNLENARRINAWLRRPYKVRRGSIPRREVVNIRTAYAGGDGFDKIRHEYRIGISTLIKILAGRTYKEYAGPTFNKGEIIQSNNIIFPS
jgi:hypothetical protein